MNDRTNGAADGGQDPQPKPAAATSGGTRAQERIAALDSSAPPPPAAPETPAQLHAELQSALQRAEDAEGDTE